MIFLYDITDFDSYARLTDWLNIVKKNIRDQHAPFYYVGSKADLEMERQVPIEILEEFAAVNDAQF